MTPLEKAQELISKFISVQDKWYIDNLVDGLRCSHAKQCALIAVDEVLIEIRKIYDIYTEVNIISIYQYWAKVKKEIEKLRHH